MVTYTEVYTATAEWLEIAAPEVNWDAAGSEWEEVAEAADADLDDLEVSVGVLIEARPQDTILRAGDYVVQHGIGGDVVFLRRA